MGVVDLFDLLCGVWSLFPAVARLEGDQTREDRGDDVALGAVTRNGGSSTCMSVKMR
jgi:hypothetical protein